MRSNSTSAAQISSGVVTGLDSGQTLQPPDSYFCCVYGEITSISNPGTWRNCVRCDSERGAWKSPIASKSGVIVSTPELIKQSFILEPVFCLFVLNGTW